jgi:hypothetical protein
MVLLKTTCFSQDYCNYYYSINNAELKIINKHFKEAFVTYDSIFKIYPINIDKDLYNAALCAIHLGKKDVAIAYCRRILITTNNNIDYFKKLSFNKLKKTKEWKNLIAELPELKRNYDKEKDSVFQSTIRKMVDLEQKNVTNKRKFDSIVFENTETLYSTFSVNPNYYLNQFTKCAYLDYCSLIRHYYGLKNIIDTLRFGDDSIYYKKLDLEKYNLDSLYKFAMHRGYLTPIILAEAKDYRNKDNIICKFSIGLWRDFPDVLIALPTKEAIERSNRLRSEYCIPSYEDEYLKIIKTTYIFGNLNINAYRKFLEALESNKEYLQKDLLRREELFFDYSDAFFEKIEKKHKHNILYDFKIRTTTFSIYQEGPKCNKPIIPESGLKEAFLNMYNKNHCTLPK